MFSLFASSLHPLLGFSPSPVIGTLKQVLADRRERESKPAVAGQLLSKLFP
jgi:hypothetical protein